MPYYPRYINEMEHFLAMTYAMAPFLVIALGFQRVIVMQEYSMATYWLFAYFATVSIVRALSGVQPIRTR